LGREQSDNGSQIGLSKQMGACQLPQLDEKSTEEPWFVMDWKEERKRSTNNLQEICEEEDKTAEMF